MSPSVVLSRDLNPGGRLTAGGPLTPHSRGPALAVALLLALLALLAGCVVLAGTPEAEDVDELQLVGPRSPGCIRLLIASDVSGSMSRYTATRAAALDRILDWAPQNLRADDELGALAFAGDARLTLPVTEVADFGRARPAPLPSALGDGTRIDGVLDVIEDLPPTACRTTLLFLSDGLLGSEPARDVDAVLGEAGVASVVTVLPEGLRAPDHWRTLFPYGTEVDVAGQRPGRLAVVLAETLAAATGQDVRRLER
ncbi:hypothetical protein [Blastococcus sp. SYSU DS1021]